jgi:hypothetical protein
MRGGTALSYIRIPAALLLCALGTAACEMAENFGATIYVIGWVGYGLTAEAIDRQVVVNPDYCDLRHSGATINLRESCNRAIARGASDPAVMATYYQARAATWGEQDRAEADYTQAIGLDPGDPGRYAARADARLRARVFDQAADDLAAAIRLSPRADVSALAGLYRRSALANWQAGRIDRSVGDYDQVVDLMRPYPHDARAARDLTCRGELNWHVGRIRDAQRDFAAALRADSHDDWTRYALAAAEMRLGNERAAAALLSEVYGPRGYPSIASLGWATGINPYGHEPPPSERILSSACTFF